MSLMSDESMSPGEIFHTPLLMIIEGLGSADPSARQAAGTWMRCHAQNYLRVIDPLLSRLVKASADLEQTRFYLESISAVFELGGSGFSKTCRSTLLADAVSPSLRRGEGNDVSSSRTYLDFVVEKALELLEASGPTSASGIKRTLRVQSACLALLGILIRHGELSAANLIVLRNHLMTKLRLEVRRNDPVLQHNLLQLLQSTIALPSHLSKGHKRTSSKAEPQAEGGMEYENRLVQVVVEGISSPRNRSVLQHWVDFVMQIAPQLAQRADLLLSLCECFDDQIRRVMLQLRAVYSGTTTDDIAAGITDAEPVVLLTGLRELIGLALATITARSREEVVRIHGDGGGSKILGLVSGVFTVEAPASETVSGGICG
jgi:hypothetical protein